jgi:DNA-binding CsgD family transcriptional regulator
MRAMSETSARLTAARVEREAAAGHPPVALLRRAVTALGDGLRADAWCGLTLDPNTMMPTGGDHRDGLPLERIPRLLALEYGGDEVSPFTAVARTRLGARTIRDATGGRPERSARFRDVLAPSGLPHELRLALRAGGRCWGALVLLRAGDARPFSAAEVALAGRLGDAVGAGLRRGLVLAAAARAEAERGPAVLVLRLRPTVAVEVATPGLAEWGRMIADTEDRGGVPVAVLSAARTALTAAGAVSRARLRTRAGTWMTLHATVADAASARVVVVLEPTRPHEVLALLMDAHGLTAREQEVVPLVLQGLSNAEIATRLVVSPWTAQDHVRNVFRKLDVSGRASLAARLFFDHYLPRLEAGSPAGAGGAPAAPG